MKHFKFTIKISRSGGLTLVRYGSLDRETLKNTMGDKVKKCVRLARSTDSQCLALGLQIALDVTQASCCLALLLSQPRLLPVYSTQQDYLNKQ